MPSEVKYEEQKHCCTSCAMKRRCHVCDQPTTLACSDCAIDLRAVIYVCNKTQCRDEHEKKCAHSLQSQLDAKWISVDERLPEPGQQVLTCGLTDGSRGHKWFMRSDEIVQFNGPFIGPWFLHDHSKHSGDAHTMYWRELPPPPSGAKGEASSDVKGDGDGKQ